MSPWAPRARCSEPGCRELAETRGRCRRHESERMAAYDRHRGNATARGYGDDWRRVRLLILERDGGVCQIRGRRCRGRATTVDHIIPLAAGGARLDPANLQAACWPCNMSKATDDRRRARS